MPAIERKNSNLDILYLGAFKMSCSSHLSMIFYNLGVGRGAMRKLSSERVLIFVVLLYSK